MKSLPSTLIFAVLLHCLLLSSPTGNATNLTNPEIANGLSLQCSIIDIGHVTCTGLPTGSAEAGATGGTPPYLYVWSNGFVGSLNVGLSAGVYTCTVTDLFGATATASVTIEEPETLELSVVAQIDIDCIHATGEVEVGATGGTPPYEYEWSTGASGATATGLTVGAYVASVTDANGCLAVQAVVIAENLVPPLVDAGPALDIDCFDPTATLQATGSTGSNFLALWTTTDGNILSGETTVESCIVNAAGTYTLTITDLLNGCTAASSCTVTADLEIPPVSADVSIDLSCVNLEVTLDGSGSMGTDASYLWTTDDGNIISGETTLNSCLVDAEGTYTLTVTSQLNGCSDTDEVSVIADVELPSANASVSLDLDCINLEVTLDGSGSSTGPDFGYLWTTTDGHIVSGANTLDNCVVDAEGTYTLLVSNLLNGCTSDATVNVEADVELPSANADVSLDLDCLNLEVTLDGSGSSTGPDFGYLWTTTDGHILSGETTLDNCIVDAEGTYTLLVTNLLNGCTSDATVSVEADVELPSANADVSLDLDCINLEVTLDGSGSSTGSDFGYLWTTLDGHIVSGASTLDNCLVDAEGTYTLLVTNLLNGCTSDATVSVTADIELPSANADVSLDLDCINLEVTLDGSGSSTGPDFGYLWTTTDGHILSGETTLDNCIVDAEGTYTLLVTNLLNGCTSDATVSVEADVELPSANADVSLDLDCINLEVTLDGSGSSTGSDFGYLWTTLDGHIVSGASTLDNCLVDAEGTYTLLVTNLLNGCTSDATVSVTADIELPSANADVSLDLDCINLEVTLDGSGSSTGPDFGYLWTTTDGHILSGETTLDNCIVDAEGTYTLLVTNLLNGCTSDATVSVEADVELPSANADVSLDLDCINLEVTLDGSGSSTGSDFGYLWTTTDGHIVAGANTLDNCIVDAEGTYTLLVTNLLNGCTSDASVSVEVDVDLPQAEANVSLDLDCINLEVTLDGSGSSTGPDFGYLWTTLDGHIVSGASTLDNCLVDAEGTYTLLVTNLLNGCTSDATVSVTADIELPSANADVSLDLDCINLEVTLDGSGSSTGPDFGYLWTTTDGHIVSGSNTLDNCIVDAEGTYTLLVSNLLNGCTSDASVTVEADVELPSANADVSLNLDCINLEVTLDGSGSSTGPDFGYLWTTIDGHILSGETTLDNCVVDAEGTYTLLVTNLLNGCTSDASVSVEVDVDTPSAEAGVGLELTCLVSVGILNGAGSSTGSNISYLWTTVDGNISAGETTLTPTVTAAGTYTLTVTNENNGCTSSDNVTVTIDLELPNAHADVDGQLDCNVFSLTLDGTGSDTGPLFIYAWATADGHIVSGANTLNNCVVDAPGTYVLTVTNNITGCSATANVTVTADIDAPTASASVDGQIDCLNASLTIDGSNSSQGSDISYFWTTVDGNITAGANTPSPEVDAAGTYTLTVTDGGNGCTASTSVSVTADLALPTAEAGVGLDLTCHLPTGIIDGTGSSVGAEFSYLWTTVDGNISAGETTLTPTVTAAGTYTLTVSNGENGCTTSDEVSVTADIDLPSANASVSVDLSCLNLEVTLDGSGSSTGSNISYLWTTTDGNILSGATSLNDCIVDAGGTYILTVTNDLSGCESTASVSVIADIDLPSANASVSVDLSCLNLEVTLDGSGSSTGSNFSYLWTTTDGNIVSGATTMNDCIVDAAGTYVLTVTNDLSGCGSSASVIADIDLPAANANVSVDLSCLNLEVTLDGSGSSTGNNFSYLWATTDGNIVSGSTTLNDCIVDAAGTYLLTVTNDLNGCESTASVSVTADIDLPAANASVSVDLSCLNLEVTLDGSGSSTGSNFSYLWTTTDGHILSGATTLNDCIVDAAGTYVLTVTNDDSGCESTASAIVIADIDLPSANASVSVDLSCLNLEVTLDGSDSSTGSNFSYLWTTTDGHILSGATTLNNCIVDAAGTYVLTVTNDNSGCESTASVAVIADIDLPSANASVSVDLSCLNLEVTLDGSGSSTGSHFSYLWTTADGNIVSGSTTLNDCIVDAAGTYVLTVTNDLNGCESTASVNVTADIDLPAANASVSVDLSCLNLEVTLDGSGSSTGSNFSYLWTTTDGNILSGSTTLNNCIVDAAGTYVLTVTNDLNGCESTASVNVTADIDLPSANASVSVDLSCLNLEVTLDGSDSSTGSNFSYLWTTTDGNIVSGATTLNDCIVDAAGTYLLTVTNDLSGCESTASVNVTADIDLPSANASVSVDLSCLNLEITLDGSGSSTGSNISYLWTTADGHILNGATTLNNCIVDAAGTYVLTVTNDLNGCESTASVNVTADIDLPQAQANVSVELTCNNLSVTLDGSGSSTGPNFNYLWTTVDGNILSGANSLNDCEVDAAGTYLLTVTNALNGCSASASVLVVADIDLPTAEAGVAVELTCLLPSVTLNGVGSSMGTDIAYLWTTVDGNIVHGETTLTPLVNVAASYTLTVTNLSNGCTASDEVQVLASIGLPAANASVIGQLDCNHTELTLSGIGSENGPIFSYLWTTANGHIVSGENTLNNCIVDAAGTYTLTVTNTLTGCSNSAAVSVTIDDEAPAATATVNGVLGCLNATVMLDGTGSSFGECFEYLWTTVDGHLVSGETNLTAICDAAGTYTLTVTNLTTGATATTNVTVTGTTTVSLHTLSMEDVDCFGNASGSISVSGSGGSTPYAYLWTSGETTASVTNLTAGTYGVTVTDANGCEAIMFYVITEPALLQANVTVTHETGLNASNGSAIAIPSGGNPPYGYLWSNGSTANGITGLAPGTYSLTLSDQNGCTETVTVVVDSVGCPGTLQASASVTNESALGANDGSASVSVSGGPAPYTYLWSNGETTASVSGLAPGAYTVVVTDATGCGAVVSITVEPFGCALAASISGTGIGCAGANGGSATVSVSAGAGNYSYLWSNGETTATVTNLPEGDYSVVVTDGAGCVEILSIEISAGTDTTPPVLVVTDVSISLDENGQGSVSLDDLVLSATDNCGEVTIECDLPAVDCDNIGANLVIVTATDEAGNETTATVTVTVVDDLPAVWVCPDDMTVSTCDGPVEYQTPGLYDNCSVSATSMNLMQGLCPGSVFPVGTTQVVYGGVDANGDISMCTFNVTVESSVEISVTSTAPTCSGFPDGTATVHISGADPTEVSILWTDPQHQTTATVTGLAAGTYTVLVADPNSCLLTQTVSIAAASGPAVSVTSVTQPGNGSPFGSINIAVSGGQAPYEYEWTWNGHFMSDLEDLPQAPIGTFVCNVTDANGCTVWTPEIIIGAIESPVEVGLQSPDEQIGIFPSPTTGEFFLSFDLDEEQEVDIELLDFTGKNVLTVSHGAMKNGNLKFDLTGARSGKYLARVRIGDETVVKQFVLTTW